MEYEYIVISIHPEDVISLSVGDQAETYALTHYKGSLRRGLNPSTSGVQPKDTPTSSSKNLPRNGVTDECNPDNGKACSSSSGTSHEEYDPHNNKGSSSSSGTAHDETDGDEVNNTGTLHIDVEPLVKKCMLLPKRHRSQEAIQWWHCLYKLRKRNQQQKHLKSPQKFEYRELTITRYFQ